MGGDLTADDERMDTMMSGYEFTKIEADFTNECWKKAQSYDIIEVARRIEHGFELLGEDGRKSEDYEDAKYWFIETTMSCSKKEAVRWMEYYMVNAMAYGLKTMNLDWRTKFLAAYDLFLGLTAVERHAANNAFLKFQQVC